MPARGTVTTYISQGAILTANELGFSNNCDVSAVEMALINALIQQKTSYGLPNIEGSLDQFDVPLYDASFINASTDPSNTHIYLHNRSIETPNFFIESIKGGVGSVQELSFNFIVGNNNSISFPGFLECVDTKTTVSTASMEFIFTQDISAVDSLGGTTWKATFSTVDPSLQLMSMAVNSKIDNSSNKFPGESILRAQNDYSFNNSFALGRDKIKFNTITQLGTVLSPPSISQGDISLNYQLATNNITVTSDFSGISGNDFGTYKFVTVSGSVLNINEGDGGIAPFNTPSIGPNITTLNDLSNNYFGPSNTSGGDWYFRITANAVSNNGYKLSDPSQSPFITLQPDIRDNRNYMNYGYGDASRNTNEIVISQPPLQILNLYGDNPDVNGMILTASGEDLLSTEASQNGVVILDASGPSQRTTIIGSASGSYTSTFVYYNGDISSNPSSIISNELMKTRDVSYSIQNILLPTGSSQYNIDHSGNVVANSNGSTLYISNDFETAPDFSSNIKSFYSSNVATYITIANNNALTAYTDAGNQFFNLTTGASFESVDVTVNATGIDISGIGALYQNYRILYKSKTINDLSLSITDTSFTLYSGLTPTLPNEIGDNNNDVKDSISISDISFNTSPYLTAKTPISTFAIPPTDTDTKKYFSQFPSIQEINGLITGSIQSLPVEITYKTENLPAAVNRNGPDVIKDEVLIEWSGGSNRSESYNVVINELSSAGRNIYKTNYTNPNSETDVDITNDSGVSIVSVKKITYTESYDPIIRVPLCGFDNLYLKLSNVTATVTYYFSETVDINNGGYVEDANRSIKCKTYKSIVRTGSTSPLSATITLNKSSVTGFLGTLQGKYINAPDSSYTNLAPFQNIDFWYENTTYINNITSSPNASISNRFNPPKKSGDIIIIKDPNYSVPLIFDASNSRYSINGFGYTSAQSFSLANNTNFPFNPDFPQNVQTFSQQPPGFNQILLDASLSLDVNNNVILKVVDRSRQINVATIKTGNTAGFISNMTIFTSNGTYFQVDKSTFTPNFGSSLSSSITQYLLGSDSSSNQLGSTGSINVDTGIKTDYSNVKNGDSIKYSLNSDSVYVNMVNDHSGPTVPISADSQNDRVSELTYRYLSDPENPATSKYSEALVLPYYRGYTFFPAAPDSSGTYIYHSDTSGTKQYYTINRKYAQASAVWNVSGTVIDSANLGNIYSGKLSDVSYGKVGSIGELVTFKFSRLPNSGTSSRNSNGDGVGYPGGSLIQKVPITVTPDTFTIVSTNNAFNKTGKLTDNSGILFTGVNGFQFLSNRITLRSYLFNEPFSYWLVDYSGTSLSIYKSQDYWGNPSSLSNYNTLVASNLRFSDLTGNGTRPNTGSFNVSSSDLMQPGTTSYLQISPPQIRFTQASIHSVSSLPYTDISSSQIYQVLSDVRLNTSSYTPFASYSSYGLNNITFSDNHNYINYNQFGSDTRKFPFNINGSILKINEIRNGNLYNNWFNDYINLLQSKSIYPLFYDVSFTPSTGSYQIKYGQPELANVGAGNRNIIFNLTGSFIPTSRYSFNLMSATTATVSIFSIHDIPGPKLRITKYTNTNPENSNNYGYNRNINYNFKPNTFRTLDVDLNVPSTLASAPYNIHTIRSTTAISSLIWSDVSTNVNLDKFKFILGATDFSGQDVIGNIIGFNRNPSINYNFTYFTAPDIMRLEDPIGNQYFRIAFNGLTYASEFVTSVLAVNSSNDFSNNETSPSQTLSTGVDNYYA